MWLRPVGVLAWIMSPALKRGAHQGSNQDTVTCTKKHISLRSQTATFFTFFYFACKPTILFVMGFEFLGNMPVAFSSRVPMKLWCGEGMLINAPSPGARVLLFDSGQTGTKHLGLASLLAEQRGRECPAGCAS